MHVFSCYFMLVFAILLAFLKNCCHAIFVRYFPAFLTMKIKKKRWNQNSSALPYGGPEETRTLFIHSNIN
uniref:Uncharacterized protein n=1 Tax=Siphoviridae sp. cttpk5 TaxID=2826496 RepID=A0A8S5NIJ5_9CAUD|nr:MAG TPA: hypothetical protein [Siphoviridae sp. cttpk5]